MKKHLLFTLGFWVLGHAGLSALEPVIQKLYPPAPPAAQTPSFGKAVAMTERFILIGDPGDDTKGNNAGAAYVHDAKTGKRLRKLLASDGEPNHVFGTSVAVSGNLVVVGATGADNGRGAVYVFDLKKGTEIRKLVGVRSQPIDTDTGRPDLFGFCVALDGTIALIGSPGDDEASLGIDCGSVYAMDVLTGRLVSGPVNGEVKIQLPATVADDNDLFGSSVAISGNVGAIGAPGDSGFLPDRTGAVHLYDIRSRQRIRMVAVADGAEGDAFGSSLAIHGNLLLIGAPNDEINVSRPSSGSAYLVNFISGGLLHKFVAPTEVTNEEFGCAVSLSGGLALVGAHKKIERGVVAGGAYLFATGSGDLLSQLNVQAGFANALYGASVTLSGNQAVISSPGDDDIKTDAGAVYLFKSLSGSVGVATLAKKGDFAPGAMETVHAGFSAYQIASGSSSTPQVLLQGTLSGTGTSGGRTQGIWSRIAGTLDLSLRLGDQIGFAAASPKVIGISNPMNTRAGFVTYYARVKGTGVTATNDEHWMVDNGVSVNSMVVEGGQPSNSPTGAAINGMGQLVGSSSQSLAAMIVGLRSTPQQTVTKTNDSAAFLFSLGSDVVGDSILEGTPSPVAGVNYGQIGPRIALATDRPLVPVELVSGTTLVTTANNAGIVLFGGTDPDLMLARKGDPAPGTEGKFNAFLGESVSSSAIAINLIRASLTGVPAAQNEGLWGGTTILRLVAQKGKQVPTLATGITYSAFLRYWSTIEGFIFLAKVAGPGVTASNDLVLIHLVVSTTTGNITISRVLMREGDLAPDCGGARIGLIQKVEVDRSTGVYAIITTLTDSDAASSQVLWSGKIQSPNLFISTPAELTRPRVRLRRGSFQSLGSTTTALTTIDFIIPTDPTGAGGRGLGGPVSNSAIALILTFANKQVLAGPLTETFGEALPEIELPGEEE